MSSIQPSASPELPSTPRDIQNPPLCVSPPLPLSEETPNGELPTVSITSGQTTIESSSVTSAIVAVAPHDIVKPWESTILCGSDVPVSVSSLLPIEVRADRNHADQIVSECTDFGGRLEDSSPTMFMNFGRRRPLGKSTLTEQQKNQKRKRATQNQLLTLEVEFNKNPTPTATVRKRIAEDINMTERSVQIWFQNRYVLLRN
jgi:Homeodomain